jgi:putative SOS response-associated peptidase YedK
METPARQQEQAAALHRANEQAAFRPRWNWEHWSKGEKPRDGFCIVTVEPNSLVADIHDRMPVIIDQEHFDQWLTGSPEEAAKLLRSYPAEKMTAHAVSERVNRTKNDSPDLIEPISPYESPRDLFS